MPIGTLCGAARDGSRSVPSARLAKGMHALFTPHQTFKVVPATRGPTGHMRI